MDAAPEEGQPRGPGASAMPSPGHLHMVGALSCARPTPAHLPPPRPGAEDKPPGGKSRPARGEAGSETVIQSDT